MKPCFLCCLDNEALMIRHNRRLSCVDILTPILRINVRSHVTLLEVSLFVTIEEVIN